MASFTTTFEVAWPAEQVFEAIRDVRAWWSGTIEGATSEVGDEFTYEVPDIHWCKIRVTEVDAPRKISWLVLDSRLTFTDVKDEWNDTTITFEVLNQDRSTHVRFTHRGLTPEIECYESCSNAWHGDRHQHRPEPQAPSGVIEVCDEVAGDLGHPPLVRVGGDPSTCTTRRSTSITNKT
ncbi:MAG: SRPBCC family protein [Acidimicrobiales bacterium]